jgi:hypothetical protein
MLAEPVNIPWTLVDSSVDTMDTTYCNKKYPPPFRSSVALSVYEPPEDELPAQISCKSRICYMKVSCTITGYQPSNNQAGQVVDMLEPVPEIDPSAIQELLRVYMACYGVLVNIAVFPPSTTNHDDLDSYPRIIDAAPKARELIQAATESGEILTTSFNKISTDRSHTTTESTENSWKAGVDVDVPVKKAKVGLKGETGAKRTDTDQDKWVIQSDASLDRKEKMSTTTTLSQLYNLLSCYHIGTNRTTFVMLPRPHVLQPTVYRSFVQGVREIEGVQDFFLVVARPKAAKRMCVDISLQTAHFDEATDVMQTTSPGEQYETRTETIGPVRKVCRQPEGIGGQVERLVAWVKGDDPPERVTEITNGAVLYDFSTAWQIDDDEGDPGHAGITEVRHAASVPLAAEGDNLPDPLTNGLRWVRRTYRKEGPHQVVLDLAIGNSRSEQSLSPPRFDRSYTVHLRRVKETQSAPVANTERLLIAQRVLCSEVEFGACPRRLPIPRLADLPRGWWIAEEVTIKDADKDPDSTTTDGRTPTGRRRLRAPAPPEAELVVDTLRSALIASQTSPYRYDPGVASYIHTQHFARQLIHLLPDEILEAQVDTVLDRPIGDERHSVRDVLRRSLHDAAVLLDVTPQEAARIKERVLDLGWRSQKGN